MSIRPDKRLSSRGADIDPQPSWPGTTLGALLGTVNHFFVNLVVAPAGTDVAIASVMIADVDDLADEELGRAGFADLCLLAGVGEAPAAAWLTSLAGIRPELRPKAVMSKAAVGSTRLSRAAQEAGVALIAVHAQTRWESLLATVGGLLDQSLIRAPGSSTGTGPGADTDLFGLAHTVASLTSGMVSIEDERSRVLAYSASDDAADELRKLSILGREGPADYLLRLRQSGVFERLTRSDEVVEVPADDVHGMRRRLVVGIRQAPGSSDGVGPGPSSGPLVFGSIWVQEGDQPLAADSAAVLQGAAAVAARLIARTVNAPTNEVVQIQRLLGARGGGVDIGSLATALAIPTSGPAVVIGLAMAPSASPGLLADLAAAVRLHASAYARESLVTTIGERIYVLIPQVRSVEGLTSWTHGMIERIVSRHTTALRAAVAAPVSNLSDVAAARSEVNRVLDATTGDQRVTTLADSRTPVLLGEILDLVATRHELLDPRLDTLLAYDAQHGASLRESLAAYLHHFGDVRSAAQQLQVHPNTLRYRVRRAEDLLGINLGDPAGRLLVEIQLGVLGRGVR